MARLTIAYGIVMIALGLVAFYATGAVAYTALIPCAIGVLAVL